MSSRQRNRLTVVKLRTLKAPGRYSDGGNLHLFVSKTGVRSWVFRYRSPVTGTQRDMGLGSALDVTLERARAKAAIYRGQLADGIDPIDTAQLSKRASLVERVGRQTFQNCCDSYIAAHRAGWRNPKHAAQWESTLETYCADLMALPVDAIDTALVVRCLEPHWATKTETMSRLRGRIESVLAWATARRYRSGENPARWRGHLDQLLPKRSKVQKVVHRPALAAVEMYDFMRELRAKDMTSAKVLELQILTATRPGETAAAQWSEFDLEAAIWTIPGERMKAGRDHRVPLSPPAVKLLSALGRMDGNVFPGVKGKPFTTAASMALLKEMRPGVTAHGFRSTFRDWAGDVTNHPRELVESALAHALKDKTEAAYRRSDALERRARLMADWAKFIDTPRESAMVTPIKGARKSARKSPASAG